MTNDFERAARAYYNAHPTHSQREGARHLSEAQGIGLSAARHRLTALFKGCEPWNGLYTPEQLEDKPKRRKVERDEQGRPLYARCVKCGREAHSAEQVDEVFGTRLVYTSKANLFPQSSCISCRSAAYIQRRKERRS